LEHLVLEAKADDLLERTLPHMQYSVLRLAPAVAAWLTELPS
jgi:hypothetical protein